MTPSGGTSAELDRVVLAGADRLGEVEADLLGVDVERGDELDVADVVVAEHDVHQTRHACRSGRRRRSSGRPAPATRRSCRRRRWRRGRIPCVAPSFRGSSRRSCVVPWVAAAVGRGRSGGRMVAGPLGVDQLVRASGPRARPTPGRAAAARGCRRPSAPGRGPASPGRCPAAPRAGCAGPRGSAAGRAASVRAKKAKRTSKLSSSQAAGPASASRSWKRSLPSAVSS